MMVEILRFTREDANRFYFKSDKHMKALRECMKLSQNVWQGTIDGEVACVWGIVTPTIISNRCYLWLMATDVADKHQFILVRYSQMVVGCLLDQYEEVVGHVLSDQHRSQKWLKWLGAEFHMPEEDGKKIPFVIRRKADG